MPHMSNLPWLEMYLSTHIVFLMYLSFMNTKMLSTKMSQNNNNNKMSKKTTKWMW